MLFLKATALFSLLASVSAIPAIEIRAATGTAFLPYLKSNIARPPVALNMEAFAGYFYMGQKSASVGCSPEDRAANSCPIGGTTRVKIWYAGTASLDVTVAGGQQIYIDNNGTLRYTAPEKLVIPEGSTTTGFKVSQDKNGKFVFSNSNGPILACPLGGPLYRIFVDIGGKTLQNENVPGKDKSKCLTVTGEGKNIDKSEPRTFYSYLA
ncbi:hypothetical protein ABW20_dc0105619 [Dactylellina cionopaga]|nr:hypothetical protein ABW20_dc0105619 [Dactylellina cionopaga]